MAELKGKMIRQRDRTPEPLQAIVAFQASGGDRTFSTFTDKQKY